MKKLIVLFIVMCSFIPLSWAMDGCNQHLSPDEFRAKQKAYITEKAGLTKEEAAKFFPVYFELQDRKKQLNDEAWNLLCLLYTSPSPRDISGSRMPSSA